VRRSLALLLLALAACHHHHEDAAETWRRCRVTPGWDERKECMQAVRELQEAGRCEPPNEGQGFVRTFPVCN
jgi:hypothetical protein